MQGLKYGLLSDVPQIVSTLSDCATDVIAWSAAKRLQLNVDKTEVMWFGSAAKLSKIPPGSSSIRIGSIDVQPVTVVRDLGVMIDAEISMCVHVSRTAQICFYHLRRLRSSRRQLGRDVTARHGSCQPSSCPGWITAMPSLQAVRLQRWRRSRQCCMLQLVWS